MSRIPALLSTEPRLPTPPRYESLTAAVHQILQAAKDTSLGQPRDRLARIISLAEEALLGAQLSDVSGDNA